MYMHALCELQREHSTRSCTACLSSFRHRTFRQQDAFVRTRLARGDAEEMHAQRKDDELPSPETPVLMYFATRDSVITRATPLQDARFRFRTLRAISGRGVVESDGSAVVGDGACYVGWSGGISSGEAVREELKAACTHVLATVCTRTRTQARRHSRTDADARERTQARTFTHCLMHMHTHAHASSEARAHVALKTRYLCIRPPPCARTDPDDTCLPSPADSERSQTT
eukprot:6212562-Pleurochrysis_carterae.AAC.4